ncbi:uncharacterized protein LOC116982895 [Amblyraja radiata]|uniref:uncharacterized protein LOC116982895 n=1 Tax=Amblyraja radiata TaxID=386614 RepID=UPI0014041F8A|nr:uncharacterized protein LOC116982895 [Amblyraja radiata]
MEMASNHSLTDDEYLPQVSDSSATVFKVSSTNIQMSTTEDARNLNVLNVDFPSTNTTEETVTPARMCSEEDEKQHHGTMQTFYKLLEIYYKIFGGRMDSDENVSQFNNWQQNIIPKMKDILKYYCTNINICKTDSTEDGMSGVQQKSTGQCNDMLENVEKIFEDEFNSEEKEQDVSSQDLITLSDFNEMLGKCCDQMYGETCENELEISEKGASERQKENAALNDIESTTQNTGSIGNRGLQGEKIMM